MIPETLSSLDEMISTLMQTPFLPKPFKIHKKEYVYQPIETPVSVEDLFAFLEAQSLYPKVYWETPEDGIFAGVGKAMEIPDFPEFQSAEGPRFYGGRDFMKRTGTLWEQVPEMAYVVPLLEIEKRGSQATLRLNRMREKELVRCPLKAPLFLPKGPIHRFQDTPSLSIWEKNVEEVVREMNRKKFLKVVLARCASFECGAPLSPYALLKMLKEKNRFCFQFSPEVAFIGTSPETLYRKQGRMIQTAALAGTRQRGSTPYLDQKYFDELFRDAKEGEEFDIVSQWITEALAPFCETFVHGKRAILKTGAVQHLYRPFQGALKDGVTDKLLMQALHPTPSLGGAPKEHALIEIQKREPFDRGWYGAPVGWVSPSGSHHLVGIRSALIVKNILNLFSGTGLVSGSISRQEWEELEHKIQPYKEALGL